MVVEYQEIRERLESDGYSVSDEDYGRLVEYARRKAEAAGKDESYMPYLLPDVIGEHLIRAAINYVGFGIMAINKEYQEEVRGHGSNDNRTVFV